MYEDEISRVAFAEPDMVRHLLALLPADATAGLDTRRLRQLPTEQVGRGARKRLPDMAWAVGAPTPERPRAEALLAIEFQAAPHKRMALRMESYVALLRQEMADELSADDDLPPALPVLVYTGDRPWQPPSLRQLTARTPAGLQRWQPELEMLALDAAKLSAEDGDINPVAALLRLQRCRRQADLPGLAAVLFGALRRDGLTRLAERLSDALMRMLVARFGGDETSWECSAYSCMTGISPFPFFSALLPFPPFPLLLSLSTLPFPPFSLLPSFSSLNSLSSLPSPPLPLLPSTHSSCFFSTDSPTISDQYARVEPC